MKTASPLAARLKRQMQADSETIQSLTKEQLAGLRKELHAIMQRELHTIRTDMEEQSRRLAGRLFWSRTLLPLLIGLSLSLGILGGSWGMMHYLTGQIRDRQATIATMEETVQELQRQEKNIWLGRCDNRLCARIDTRYQPYPGGYYLLLERK